MILEDPADLRAAARRGEWTGSTAGQCPGYQQANLVLLPSAVASEFAAFCTRNPKPCPLIEITPPGDPEPRLSAPGADLRTDVPGYRVYEKGELVFKGKSLDSWWRDDLVGLPAGMQLHLRARADRRRCRNEARASRDDGSHVHRVHRVRAGRSLRWSDGCDFSTHSQATARAGPGALVTLSARSRCSRPRRRPGGHRNFGYREARFW